MNKNTIWQVKAFTELTVEELYNILKIRQEVFIVEQNCVYLDTDSSDDKALHLWSEENGNITSYCRIFDRGIKYDECSIGRVVSHPNSRRQNLGKILLRNAIEIIENRLHCKEITISAQDYLLNFYREFGFEDTGKKYFEDGIPHTEMRRSEI